MLFSRYICAACGLELPSGWGAFLYVTDAAGERIACPHPLEHETIRRVAGLTYEQAEAADRTGYQTQCVCLACFAQFPLDLERDPLQCPACACREISPAADLIGHECPRCRKGLIEDRAIQPREGDDLDAAALTHDHAGKPVAARLRLAIG